MPVPLSGSTAGGGSGGGPSASRQRLLAAAALDPSGVGPGASLDPAHYHVHHQIPGAAGRGPSPSPLATRGTGGQNLLLANGIVPRQRPVSALGGSNSSATLAVAGSGGHAGGHHGGGGGSSGGSNFVLPAFPDRSAGGLAGSRTFGGGFASASSPGRAGSASAALLSPAAGGGSTRGGGGFRAPLSASSLRPVSALPAARRGTGLGGAQPQHGRGYDVPQLGELGGPKTGEWATTRRLADEIAAAAGASSPPAAHHLQESKEVSMHDLDPSYYHPQQQHQQQQHQQPAAFEVEVEARG